MGTRGPVPKTAPTLTRTIDPADLVPPAGLCPMARQFWEQNVECVLHGTDLCSYALMGQLWVKTQTTEGREYADAVRQYLALARQFGLTPDSRRRLTAASPDRHADKTEFRFDE
jgi:hypothetical protein